MSSETPRVEGGASTSQWLHPSQVMQLQRLKYKKKQLQARINKTDLSVQKGKKDNAEDTQPLKRKNPFIKDQSDCKRNKLLVPEVEESSDQTLFKLLHFNDNTVRNIGEPVSFSNILKENNSVAIVKNIGKSWIPIDWALKTKVRLLSSKPFPWNQRLKISEEASGITGYVRCLDSTSTTNLDISPNSKFHQSCLYWQQPSLPWLTLFPRSTGKASTTNSSIASQPTIREHLQTEWANSLRCLFQLVRTKQCPYFYTCANNFTILFRAAGICGCSEIQVLITPTTRGLRHLLKQEDINFSMPLKLDKVLDHGQENLDLNGDEEAPDEKWLESMGIAAEDIKQINYSQERVVLKNECEVDCTEQSLVLIEGVEVHAFYNFLMNSKSIVAITGPLAGVPPTLIAPVAFQGATLNCLKVRSNKVRADGCDYYSLELCGPILPHTLHNLFTLHPPEHSLTATFAEFSPTVAFSKVATNRQNLPSSGQVFGKENLSDCGLNPVVLKQFCESNAEYVQSVECLKYEVDSKTFTWS